ncbi:MAG: methyltransferase [Pyrinomonadaceae bacterium]
MIEKLTPKPLLEIAFGYQRSNIIFTLVELKIPTLLQAKPLSLEAIARETKIHPRALDRLLNAAVALGVLEKLDDKTFQNGELSAKFLIEKTEDFLGSQMSFYRENSYQNWIKLTEKLREWQPGADDEQSSDEEDQDADTLPPQHNLALLVGKALGRAFDFSDFKKMLDVGGGTGAMSLGICEVNEHLQATVWDLAKVLETTAKFVKESKLQDRVKTTPGNFKKDALPKSFDCILLANLLSVASEKTNRKFLKQIYDALPAGGVCLISGWILDDTRTAPEAAVLFCLEDIINQVPDVERTENVYREWLEEAGFTNIRREIYLAPYSYIAANKK